MKSAINRLDKGAYAAILSALLALTAGIVFLIWAPAHNAMEALVPACLFAGVIAQALLVLAFDTEYVAIAATGLYSVALFRILAGAVGSFVDAYQGIHMFGDSSQLGVILVQCALILAAVSASTLSCFWRRRRAA